MTGNSGNPVHELLIVWAFWAAIVYAGAAFVQADLAINHWSFAARCGCLIVFGFGALPILFAWSKY